MAQVLADRRDIDSVIWEQMNGEEIIDVQPGSPPESENLSVSSTGDRHCSPQNIK